MPARLFLAAALLAFLGTASRADDTTDKQKKEAVENLKKSEAAKGTVVETDNFFIASELPETKARGVGEHIQKTYKLARKTLQFEDKEEPWKGKLVVYIFPEARNYKQFMRLVAGQRPEDTSHVSVRSDNPYIVSGVEFNEKATEADIAADVTPLLAGAMLSGKIGAGAMIPEWVRTGFGRAAALRAEGTQSKRFSTYKTAAKNGALAGKGVPIAEVWGGTRKDGDLLATSLMDYIAFGPGSASLIKFLNGFRPNETTPNPTVVQALESAMWKEPTLDAAWKKWIQGGLAVK